MIKYADDGSTHCTLPPQILWKKTETVNSENEIQFVTLVSPLPEFIFLDKIFNLEQ